MNDYATFQHHDKRHIDKTPKIIARLDALHGLIVIFLYFDEPV
jgi:hypothetical protein